jgi:hypothetical protein
MADFVRRRINILYDTLRDIRVNIVDASRINEYNNTNTRNETFQLSYDQRFLIDLYSTMYNATLRQLEYLERYSEQFDNTNRIFINGRPYIIDQINAEIPLNDENLNETQHQRQSRQRPATPFNSDLLNLSELLNETLRNFNNPVVVRPTETEIANATRQVAFGDIQSPKNTSCPICLDTFEPETTVTQIIHCEHLFSTTEINRWFQTNVKCPVCRYDIRNRMPTDNHPQETTNTTHRRSRRQNMTSPLQSRVFETSSHNANTSTNTYSNTHDNTNEGNPFSLTNQQLFSNLLNNMLDSSGNQTIVFDTVFRM